VDAVSHSIGTNSFAFAASAPGQYALQASGVGFNGFGLGWGPVKYLTAIPPPPILLSMSSPSLNGSQIALNFVVESGTPSSFHLLSTSNLAGPWSADSSAILTTNGPGASYSFTVATNAAVQFYRVRVP
jgi:hypothetical protein